MTATESSAGSTRSQILRFLIVGGTNTVVTYALFIGLGLLIEPWVAYTIAFFSGLTWTVFGSARFVFRASLSIPRLLLFSAWYLMIYGAGQLVIRLMNPGGFTDLVITSLLVLVVTTPLTFVGGRFVFVPRPQKVAPFQEDLSR